MIRNRNIDPKCSARTVTARDSFVVLTPPTDTDCYVASQTLVQNVANQLNLDGLLIVNAQTVDSAGTVTVNAKAGTLIYPSDLIFTLGAAVALTGILDAVDHLGRPVYFEFTKASAQTTFSLAQNTQITITQNGKPGVPARSPFCCYSAINSLTLTNLGADTTVIVGWSNVGGNNFRMPRIPLPVPIDNIADVCDQVLLKSVGGATVTTPAAVPAQVTNSQTVLGSNDCLNFASGAVVETVAGTSPYEWVVGYRGGRNAAL